MADVKKKRTSGRTPHTRGTGPMTRGTDKIRASKSLERNPNRGDSPAYGLMSEGSELVGEAVKRASKPATKPSTKTYKKSAAHDFDTAHKMAKKSDALRKATKKANLTKARKGKAK